MIVTKREHEGYTVYQNMPKDVQALLQIPCMFGKYQWLYESSDRKKKISLIEFYGLNSILDIEFAEPTWEIFALKSNDKLFGTRMFKGVEKYHTHSQAVTRIRELLN